MVKRSGLPASWACESDGNVWESRAARVNAAESRLAVGTAGDSPAVSIAFAAAQRSDAAAKETERLLLVTSAADPS